MNNKSIASCGVICDLCLGFQREKNRCSGCNSSGNKPYHCTVCSIKYCPEKKKNDGLLCLECAKFPCRRIKDLNKRYTIKYGVSLIGNLNLVKEIGPEQFIELQKEKWTCKVCGQLLCVHQSVCLSCGSRNPYFPVIKPPVN